MTRVHRVDLYILQTYVCVRIYIEYGSFRKRNRSRIELQCFFSCESNRFVSFCLLGDVYRTDSNAESNGRPSVIILHLLRPGRSLPWDCDDRPEGNDRALGAGVCFSDVESFGRRPASCVPAQGSDRYTAGRGRRRRQSP